ncbi:BatD [hydrothermal vent metagenome]|uniref:BatD n=1 Tax=hydrothermal vent metagenome TaxID=652676 RepID=A0A1W1EFN1_9ZZZZ
MKHALGNIVLFLFVIFMPLHAENFTYDFHVDNSEPYKNEPIFLSVDINQTNPNVVLFFDFAVKESNEYRAVQIDSVQDTTLHHSYIHYLYVLYPLKEGEIDINFDLVERVTDEHKVAYSFSGDRDDFKKLETKDRKVTVAPVHLQVKALPAKTQLVGDFKLSWEIKQHKAEAYEPINMKVLIEGEGFPPVLDHLFPNKENIHFFRQAPEVKRFMSKKGIKYRVTYTMAVSSADSFTLSPLELHAFNPVSKTSYLLKIPKQHFDIHHNDRSILVDNRDNPAPFHIDFSWLISLLGYLAAFTAGYLSSRVVRTKKRETNAIENPLAEKIRSCEDAKSLLQLLMAADRQTFSPDIETLENSLYRDGKINLKKIKQSALEKLS